MKLFLRYFRDSLIALFRAKGYGAGFHHWTVERWLKDAQKFAVEVLGRPLCKEPLCGLIMLLYSAFGSNAQRTLLPKDPKKPVNKEKLKIYNGLGKNKKEKLVLYHSIFANNSKVTREKFFKLEVVKGFWHAVLPFMTKELCFANKNGVVRVNPSLVSTFREIA
jgi:hypothetical protein